MFWRASRKVAAWRAAIAVVTAVLLGGGRSVAAPPSAPGAPIDGFIAEASQRFAIPQGWLAAMIHAESAGAVDAVSNAGAMGLMQLMPSTYANLRAPLGLGPDAFDPHDNITAGAAYVRQMLDRFGAPGFLAAYNAGPARYLEFLLRGRPLPIETRIYVARLHTAMAGAGAFGVASSGLQNAVASPPPQLFVLVNAGGSASAPPNLQIDAEKTSSGLAPREQDARMFVTVGALEVGP
jgi:soluble lytic murein transglycosylase-like protein